MGVLFSLILLAVALVAIGFVVFPLLRKGSRPLSGRLVLMLALALAVLGIGGGTYLILGQPELGVRSLEGPDNTDLRSLIATLARKMMQAPDRERGWILLGRGYLSLNDPGDAAQAFKRAIALAEARGEKHADYYAAYGEALVRQSSGIVTGDAETAFRQALAIDPKDPSSRFFLGLALASHGKDKEALSLWQGLLADTPAGAPWRSDLIDRIAALRAQSGGTPPDISAMVAGLAARLETQPNDPAGWQRLIRAYAVLGEQDKAKRALGDARHALAGDAQALAAIEAEAKSLKLTD